MKHQALFSPKGTSKKIKMSSAAIFVLRVKIQMSHKMSSNRINCVLLGRGHVMIV